MRLKPTKIVLNQLHKDAVDIVKRSTYITLKFFCPRIDFKVKQNLTPVTIADIKCEEFIIENILKKYPTHNIYSEESGKINNNSEFTWFIDPIDGTKNFMRGYPYWGTLLALEYNEDIIIGIIYLPALDDMITSIKGGGCRRNGKKIKVSNTKKIADSYILHGGIASFGLNYRNNFFKLAKKCYYSRGFGDCHGHTFVMDGRAEAMLDPMVMPYDVAATKICIEEAGGMFSDFRGNPSIYNKTAIISNNKQIHGQIIKILNK